MQGGIKGGVLGIPKRSNAAVPAASTPPSLPLQEEGQSGEFGKMVLPEQSRPSPYQGEARWGSRPKDKQGSLMVRTLSIILLTFLLILPATAREEIRVFNADMTVNTDASVTVTETLEVNAEGAEIRRGIYRDIPVILLGSNGAEVRPNLDVTTVTRDGEDETFRVERMGDFQRIWIGNPDIFLDSGVHTYAITYTMTRAARAFEDHDELYWNVTGNYWIFPILSARATVRLPDGAVISQLAGYTGPVGSTEQAVTTKRNSDATASFRATRELGAGEGMTIAVAFNKGVVVFPTGAGALAQTLADLSGVIFPLIATVLAIAFNAFAWNRVGRDPPKGTIIPLFHPPKAVSPPLVHYIHRWGFQNSGWPALTSAIFDLGVKGLVTIDNSDGSLAITRTGKQPDEALPGGEQVLLDYLDQRTTTVIDKSNGAEWATKRAEFTSAIEKENGGRWFKNNIGYSILGFLLAAVLLFTMVAMEWLDILWLIGAIAAGVVVGAIIGIISRGFSGFKFRNFFGFVWIALFGLNMLGGLAVGAADISINTAAIAAFSIVITTVIFALLMRAPTPDGRKVMDQIEGLKLYLETAEKERMNINGEPPLTIERFERLLPYAIALDVEKPWSDHFEAELARNAVEGADQGYSPHWYRGPRGSAGRSASGISNAVSAAAASMTAAMVAAQPVQASSSGFSSGSSSGGSSGGGSGGGGGGGW